jgi:hypothetical protein
MVVGKCVVGHHYRGELLDDLHHVLSGHRQVETTIGHVRVDATAGVTPSGVFSLISYSPRPPLERRVMRMGTGRSYSRPSGASSHYGRYARGRRGGHAAVGGSRDRRRCTTRFIGRAGRHPRLVGTAQRSTAGKACGIPAQSAVRMNATLHQTKQRHSAHDKWTCSAVIPSQRNRWEADGIIHSEGSHGIEDTLAHKTDRS